MIYLIISIGIGIASTRKEKTFVTISESTFQDKISSLIKIIENKPENLILFVLNFKKYEEFLQKQVFSTQISTELHKIAKGLGIKSYNITKIKEFKAIIKKKYMENQNRIY